MLVTALAPKIVKIMPLKIAKSALKNKTTLNLKQQKLVLFQQRILTKLLTQKNDLSRIT